MLRKRSYVVVVVAVVFVFFFWGIVPFKYFKLVAVSVYFEGVLHLPRRMTSFFFLIVSAEREECYARISIEK